VQLGQHALEGRRRRRADRTAQRLPARADRQQRVDRRPGRRTGPGARAQPLSRAVRRWQGGRAVTDLARRRPRLAGAAVLGLCVVALLLVLTRTVPVIGGGGGRSVKLVFAAADDLRVGDAVRVRGIRVGGVTSVRLDAPNRDAVVTARITDEGLRLTNVATATLRWGTLLGGSVYVDLDPGSPLAAPMRANLIPRARTATQVTFDDLNNVYTATTRQASQTVFAQMSRALSDT